MENGQKYPEHEKLRAVVDQSQAIHEFLNWLSDTKSIFLAEWDESDDACASPTSYRITGLVAEFLNIDEKKLSDEKDQMVKEMRDANQRTPAQCN